MKTFKFLHFLLVVGPTGLCLVNIKTQTIIFKK